MFRFMQQVITPRGTGLFIGALTDGTRCQVAIWDGKIQKNPIFQLEQVQPVTGPKQAYRPRPEPEPEMHEQDTAFQPSVTARYTP